MRASLPGEYLTLPLADRRRQRGKQQQFQSRRRSKGEHSGTPPVGNSFMSKNKPARQKQVYRDGVQLLIEKKARSFVAAEGTMGGHFDTQPARHEVAESFVLPFESAFPQSISSTVWVLSMAQHLFATRR